MPLTVSHRMNAGQNTVESFPPRSHNHVIEVQKFLLLKRLNPAITHDLRPSHGACRGPRVVGILGSCVPHSHTTECFSAHGCAGGPALIPSMPIIDNVT